MDELRKENEILLRMTEILAELVVGKGKDWSSVQNDAHRIAETEWLAAHPSAT
jgi:hypothetical protein